MQVRLTYTYTLHEFACRKCSTVTSSLKDACERPVNGFDMTKWMSTLEISRVCLTDGYVRHCASLNYSANCSTETNNQMGTLDIVRVSIILQIAVLKQTIMQVPALNHVCKHTCSLEHIYIQ